MRRESRSLERKWKKKRSPDKNRVLLNALAGGATVENAARNAGMGTRTAYRRLREPEFCRQLNQQRADRLRRIATMLSNVSPLSVKILVELLQDVSVPAAVRRGAARDVMEMNIKYAQQVDLDQRIAALEERLPQATEDLASSAGLLSEQPGADGPTKQEVSRA